MIVAHKRYMMSDKACVSAVTKRNQQVVYDAKA